VPSFGIIAEGITDQHVIENILHGVFEGTEDEVIVRYVQPPLDETGSSGQPAPGGWGLVLRALERGQHQEALQFNDYIVVQIDTDASQQKGYGVAHFQGGKQLSPEELVARVVDKLTALMGEAAPEHQHKVLFAIAVDGIECWLLPLFYPDKRAAKVTGCLKAVNEALKRRRRQPLSTEEKKGRDRVVERKSPSAYEEASLEYTERARLMAVYDKNPSLRLFVEQVEAARAASVARKDTQKSP
jgi:hypothetical protein